MNPSEGISYEEYCRTLRFANESMRRAVEEIIRTTDNYVTVSKKLELAMQALRRCVLREDSLTAMEAIAEIEGFAK